VHLQLVKTSWDYITLQYHAWTLENAGISVLPWVADTINQDLRARVFPARLRRCLAFHTAAATNGKTAAATTLSIDFVRFAKARLQLSAGFEPTRYVMVRHIGPRQKRMERE
jgi:hypothetical protein